MCVNLLLDFVTGRVVHCEQDFLLGKEHGPKVGELRVLIFTLCEQA